MRFRQWLYKLPLRLRSLFRRNDVERELSDELQDHLERKTREFVADGLTTEEARRKALRGFGGVELSKENCRDARRVNRIEAIVQDVRYGMRVLRKSPGFTATVVLTLGLGIGANAAIFSVVYAVLLKPLPYPQAERLAMVYENVHLPNYQNERNEPSPGNFSAWKKESTVFAGMAAYRNRSWNVTGAGEPLRVEGELVSADFFSVLQVNASLGRTFTSEEDRPGNSDVAVLGNAFWKTEFGSDAKILGKKIVLDGESYEIVGVMPPEFHFPDPDDQLWVPMSLSPAELDNFGSHYLEVFARLKAGVNVARAQSETNLIARNLTELHPDSNSSQTVNVVSLNEDIAGPVRPALLILLVAVGLTLLIVCANVANLVLARGSARQREVAVRVALGASRSRIFSQLLTESLLLALLGCALGLLLARFGVDTIRVLAAARLPRAEEFSLNAPVVAFTVVISILAALAFGLAPALQAPRARVHDALKAGARGSATSSPLRGRSLLVVLETAVGVVVAVGAGLLLRSFLAIQEVPLGFEPQGILSFRVIPRGEKYSEVSKRAAFYEQTIERLQALPGVKSTAAVSFIPLTLARAAKGFTIEGRISVTPGQIPMANYDVVTPGYFPTMRIPLLEGRDFSWGDSPRTEPVLIINQAMANKYWPSEAALGKRIRQGGANDTEFPWLTVVGVVGNVREHDPLTAPQPTMYFPIAQFADPGGVLRDWVVRTQGDPIGVASSIPAAIWDVDKNLPVTRLQTMETVRSTSVASQRLNLVLLGAFAALALVLAALGIYGVTSYGVTQRTREIGIRIALGARRYEVMRGVVGQGLRLAGLGLTLGLLGAVAFTRLMASLIYGIRATDPVTFLAVALLLTLVALAACYIPARRAMRVDPMAALRYE